MQYYVTSHQVRPEENSENRSNRKQQDEHRFLWRLIMDPFFKEHVVFMHDRIEKNGVIDTQFFLIAY